MHGPLTGVDFKNSESHDELSENVASEISKFDLHVVKNDCHRNSNKHKSATNSGKTVSIPPSVTVRFYNSHKKDTVPHKYINYENKKPKKVRVYQPKNNDMQYACIIYIYIIIPKCACVCVCVCLFVQVLLENN